MTAGGSGVESAPMLRTPYVFLLGAVSAAVSLPAPAGEGTAEVKPDQERPGPSGLPPPPVVLARVGREIITRSDIDELSAEFLQRLVDQKLNERLGGIVEGRRRAKEAGTWTDAAEGQYRSLREGVERSIPRKGIEREARSELLRRALVYESARRSGYLPDEVVIEWRVKRTIARAKGVEQFERRTGRTVGEMRVELRRKDLSTRFFTDFLPHGVMPGPAEIRAYYRANRSRLEGSPLVKLRAIEMPTGPDRKEAFERADELRRELQYDSERFKMRAEDLAETEEEKARAGLVVDSRTGKAVEWVRQDALPPLVARATRALKPGEVSDVIEEKGVFLLIKLEGRKPAEPVPLQKVSEDILKLLMRDQEARTVQEWSEYYLGEVYMADGRGRRISVKSFVGD